MQPATFYSYCQTIGKGSGADTAVLILRCLEVSPARRQNSQPQIVSQYRSQSHHWRPRASDWTNGVWLVLPLCRCAAWSARNHSHARPLPARFLADMAEGECFEDPSSAMGGLIEKLKELAGEEP